MLKIALPDLNDFVVQVTLDSTIWRLHLGWNDSAGLWSLDVRDSSDTTIVRGIRCVPNFPLLNQYRRPALPPGDFLCVVSDDTYASIDRDDFVSGKATLVYVTEVEMSAFI